MLLKTIIVKFLFKQSNLNFIFEFIYSFIK